MTNDPPASIDTTGYSVAALLQELKIANELRKEAEIRAESAQKALEMKSMAIARMSHDIRTPLNGVIGMTSLLQTTPLTSEQSEFVETIQSSSSFLLELLQDFLDHSKMEAGKIDLEASPFNLVKVVNECVRTVSFEASKKDLPIYVNTHMSPSDRPEHVLHIGDALRIKQIVLNYLSNAVKFTATGEINVDIFISSWDDEYGKNECIDEIRFEVSDTGIGISDPSKLFAPFQQATVSTTREYGGFGLGLNIARALTELMGGDVKVSSEIGKGTRLTTTIRLPRVPTTPSGSQHKKMFDFEDPSLKLEDLSDFNWREKCRILVAEDNRVNQKVLLHMLKRLGYTQIDLTCNGLEALEHFRKSREEEGPPYDVVLMDCHMPVMDGMAASRAIRDLEVVDESSEDILKRSRIPIVALTASVLQSDRNVCFECGMDDFMTKPIGMPCLDACIFKWAHFNTIQRTCSNEHTVRDF